MLPSIIHSNCANFIQGFTEIFLGSDSWTERLEHRETLIILGLWEWQVSVNSKINEYWVNSQISQNRNETPLIRHQKLKLDDWNSWLRYHEMNMLAQKIFHIFTQKRWCLFYWKNIQKTLKIFHNKESHKQILFLKKILSYATKKLIYQHGIICKKRYQKIQQKKEIIDVGSFVWCQITAKTCIVFNLFERWVYKRNISSKYNFYIWRLNNEHFEITFGSVSGRQPNMPR